MKNKKPNAEQVWKEIEDVLAPRLRLSITDRVVYFHLLRHSRLEGRRQLHFSILRLGRSTGLSHTTVRESVRRLIVRGVLRLVERTKAGHLIEVLLPSEIRFTPAAKVPRGLGPVREEPFLRRNFTRSTALRHSIHAREGGRCFYCRIRLTVRTRCLDHVIPRVETEDDSYRNLVSCCRICNSLKSDSPAATFLHRLYLDHRLNNAQLTARLRVLDDLLAGKLRPPLPAQGHTGNHR